MQSQLQWGLSLRLIVSLQCCLLYFEVVPVLYRRGASSGCQFSMYTAGTACTASCRNCGLCINRFMSWVLLYNYVVRHDVCFSTAVCQAICLSLSVCCTDGWCQNKWTLFTHSVSMRPVATDGVLCAVCVSVGQCVWHMCELCMNDWTDEDALWQASSFGARNHVLDARDQVPPTGMSVIREDMNPVTVERVLYCYRLIIVNKKA